MPAYFAPCVITSWMSDAASIAHRQARHDRPGDGRGVGSVDREPVPDMNSRLGDHPRRHTPVRPSGGVHDKRMAQVNVPGRAGGVSDRQAQRRRRIALVGHGSPSGRTGLRPRHVVRQPAEGRAGGWPIRCWCGLTGASLSKAVPGRPSPSPPGLGALGRCGQRWWSITAGRRWRMASCHVAAFLLAVHGPSWQVGQRAGSMNELSSRHFRNWLVALWMVRLPHVIENSRTSSAARSPCARTMCSS